MSVNRESAARLAKKSEEDNITTVLCTWIVIDGCNLVKLTILTAKALPTWLAHTGEGSMAVYATLRTLLVAWKRCALVIDFWSTTYNAFYS